MSNLDFFFSYFFTVIDVLNQIDNLYCSRLCISVALISTCKHTRLVLIGGGGGRGGHGFIPSSRYWVFIKNFNISLILVLGSRLIFCCYMVGIDLILVSD